MRLPNQPPPLHEMPFKDEMLWNAMIDGYAKNGDFEESLIAFKKMVYEDMIIDGHVSRSLGLGASGSLKQVLDWKLYSFYCAKVGKLGSASNVFGLDSDCINIVSCTSLINGRVLIKLHFEQGTQLHAQLLKFSCDCDPFVSSILVDMYGNAVYLITQYKCLRQLLCSLRLWEFINGVFARHMKHVLLSGMYAKEKKWDNLRSLGKMLRDENLKKVPGYSWVDVGNETHASGAEDWSHPQRREIFEKLDRLLDR
ncbi:hypothetical protein RJ640_005119 [Escallonia rubra]|uniref:Pentatricopeptide repeat-containing protein n=1 Tax=Escallonia rubra TaxID=112253 RepID=A0AA88S4S3_9ASTE|nr:hypothetical protein RJ640_005119 [Escallonia rubra]